MKDNNEIREIYSDGFSIKTFYEKRCFGSLSDEETICYVMCFLCGWKYRRLEKIIKISNPTIKSLVESAISKRREDGCKTSKFIKKYQRIWDKMFK